MRAPRQHSALACLALVVPSVARAMGTPDEGGVAVVLLCLGLLAVSAVLLLALFVSLFVSRRSLTLPTLVVGLVDVLAACLMLDSSVPITAWVLGLAGAVLLVFAFLVGVGESMLKQSKAKEPSSPEAPREPSERAPE